MISNFGLKRLKLRKLSICSYRNFRFTFKLSLHINKLHRTIPSTCYSSMNSNYWYVSFAFSEQGFSFIQLFKWKQFSWTFSPNDNRHKFEKECIHVTRFDQRTFHNVTRGKPKPCATLLKSCSAFKLWCSLCLQNNFSSMYELECMLRSEIKIICSFLLRIYLEANPISTM